jgi:translation initiation factor 2B subunit (eIF-2B alpha/beta/delta family)
LTKADVYFAHHLMKLFHQNIKLIQKNQINVSNLFDIMVKLRTQLLNRRPTKFFGSKVYENLQHFSDSDQKEFKAAALKFYDRAIDYLEKI